MEIRLANFQEFSFEEVMAAKDKGGAFVTYQWILPLPLFYPIRRLSKVYFMPPGADHSQYALKYNQRSMLLGWWGLPWGPVFVHRSIRLNKGGGIDVTADVYGNLTQEGYEKGLIVLEQTFSQFVHPSANELKEYRRIFNKLSQEIQLRKPVIVGVHIDVEGDPVTYIGFHDSIEGEEERITKAIYKRFFKQHRFQLLDLSTNFELKEALVSQGLEIANY